MKKAIIITRIADPKRNNFMLAYENGQQSGPYMAIGLRGESSLLLTLCEGPTRGEKGIRFPGLGNLRPGESRTVTNWELGLIGDQFEPLNA